MSDVTITATRADNQKYVIQVAVYSNRKAGLKATVDVDPGKAQNNDHLIKLIAAAGGACAEYLCEHHKENHEPSECARAAVNDFAREMALMAELKRDLPERVKALAALPLDISVRAKLDRIAWTLGHGESPTRTESTWVTAHLAT